MPYRGICEQTWSMTGTFWLKGTLQSGDEASGKIGRKGRARLRNRNPLMTVEKSSEDEWKDGILD